MGGLPYREVPYRGVPYREGTTAANGGPAGGVRGGDSPPAKNVSVILVNCFLRLGGRAYNDDSHLGLFLITFYNDRKSGKIEKSKNMKIPEIRNLKIRKLFLVELVLTVSYTIR